MVDFIWPTDRPAGRDSARCTPARCSSRINSTASLTPIAPLLLLLLLMWSSAGDDTPPITDKRLIPTSVALLAPQKHSPIQTV